VQAVVSDSGPIDLLYQFEHDCLRHVASQFLGGPPEGKRADLYREASPVNLIAEDTPPLLLLYGGADAQVPVATADQFVLALGRARLRDVTYYRLAFVDHCPYSLVRIPRLREVVNEFFLRTLLHPEATRPSKR
jgi:dipeptidyl aminopeptidase/acylaminoacyl peptidase